jgi:hypothetical protein
MRTPTTTNATSIGRRERVPALLTKRAERRRPAAGVAATEVAAT